jgi:oligopeptidase B
MQTFLTQAPKAARKPQIFEKHGLQWTDDYFWLRNREEEEVLDYLRAENAYTDAALEGVKGLRESLFQEMKSRIKEQDMSVPYTLNGYSYYTRYEEGKEYPYYCRAELNGGTEEVMLDENELAAPHEYYEAVGLNVSDDNTLLAFGEDTLSRRIYTLRFKNLTTGVYLPDVISGTTGGAIWASDNSTLFYTKKDPHTLRAFQIYRHVLGTPVEEDVLVYEEKDDTFYAYVGRSKSKEYIMIQCASTLTSEWHVLPAGRPLASFAVIQTRMRGLEYDVDHLDDFFFIRHNHDSPNFMLSRTPVGATGIEHWQSLIPHRENVLLEGVELFRNFLVTDERENGLTQLVVHPWEDMSQAHRIIFKDPAYSAYAATNVEMDSETFRYGYTSLTTPNSVYDYNMRSRDTQLLKQQEVLGDFDVSNYQSERLLVTARDGVQVPLSIVYRKGFRKDGNQPLLLYGYGSYGNSMDAYFSSARLSLLDRGFAFAIAHIRGGEEMGRQWYEDGKLLKKMNTFNDFIDCADYLVSNAYSSAQHLYAMGGSAGGLLMGAVVNMRPELWRGIVAQVPFVDVINTMLDASIPLTTGEYDEWGNPDDPAYFRYIQRYSPYDNVKAQAYPNMLVTTGLHDSQVQYWEPAKWVAKLRDVKTDQNLLLLYTEMTTGHGGASGRFARLKEVAMEYAFLLMLEHKS